jgi:hypothetical protein
MSYIPPLHWGKDDTLGTKDQKPQFRLMLGVPERSFLETRKGTGDFLRPSL